MDASELLEMIAQLIHQAEQGEIDPWDVQVVEVIDRYIELMAPEKSTKGYEADLSQSGQAFLSASMLVLFKANTLMKLQSAEDEIDAYAEDEFLLDGEDGLNERIARLPLEKQLRRRRSAMPPPARRVSLQELIDQLQVMANQLQLVQKTSNPLAKKRQPGVKTLKAALELAHQENLTEVAGELEQVLQTKAAELHLGESWMNLEQLVEWWSQSKSLSAKGKNHPHGENAHTVSVFWALLLLSAQSKVELYQEEFYQEVKIRLLAESTNSSMSQAAS
ncbi:segregation/condensation protein A [Plectonema cf. radiosum LEGE 06105]|uniref:Segregation and condensation protein A n=1 Tax=Plectonema cf. radiosum LEGE 06105 TaxID=945769 RepID=A0A8J7K2Y1_9CYAN|nr:ScpA family protein [Plectonema radiosum]MBE9213432.1 segregation/condensation protein A [Plectonema cf. radiosum LEGE 06105]